MKKRVVRIAFLLALAILSVGVTDAQTSYTEGDFALSDARPQSCQTIIDTSVFYGTCCSLNSTISGGCVLNVKNGWCRISGQYWAETWNSTDDSIACDPSEWEIKYSILWDTPTPTTAPTSAPTSVPNTTSAPTTGPPSTSATSEPTPGPSNANVTTAPEDMDAATSFKVASLMALSVAVSAFLF